MIYTLKRDDMPLLSQWINKKELLVDKSSFFGGATSGIRSCEDSFTFPLTSELDALCGENVNWILLRFARRTHFAQEWRIQRKEKTTLRKGVVFLWRRHPDLNWGMKLLQSFALPLGHGAVSYAYILYQSIIGLSRGFSSFLHLVLYALLVSIL